MYDRDNPTEPKLSKVTGHRQIGKEHKGQTVGVWNEKTRKIERQLSLYAYCIDCQQYAWAQDAICPNRTIKVPVSIKVLV